MNIDETFARMKRERLERERADTVKARMRREAEQPQPAANGHDSDPRADVPPVEDTAEFTSNGAGAEQKEKEPKPRLQWADTSGWDNEPCPDRDWAVNERVPLRQVTLFSGEGAIGKSITELMLGVAHVTAKDWLGSLPEPGGAFYLGR